MKTLLKIESKPFPLRVISSVLVAWVAVRAPAAHAADWLDDLGFGKKANPDQAGIAATALSQDQMSSGLKEALAKGIEHAVASLGKEDGFLKDLEVKILMPDTLKRVEKTMRMLGQGQQADEFITSMNRAAEKATPEAAAVLGNSVKQMTLTDAKTILTGTNNAATQYFRRTSEADLYERFHPIVAKATEQIGVTSAYKELMGKASFASSFFGQDAGDIDAYVTHKALDGLFLKIAEEEKHIRENPVARTTDVLRQVFGAFQSR
jgi:hypothetical protein